MLHISAEFWAWFSLFVMAISTFAYFRSAFQGNTKPHMFSWLIWGTIPAIAFFAQHAGGAGPGAWTTGFSALGALSIAVLGFYKGETDITRSDWCFFLAALAAVPLWYFTRDPLWAVILLTLIDIFGFYPTFRKSWHKPDEELLFAYVLSVVIFLMSILALESVTWTTALYPATLVFMNAAFVCMALSRRRALNPSPKAL